MNPRARSIFIGAVFPIAVAAVAAALMLSWLPELPNRVAIHWGPDGADGFGSPWVLVLMPLAVAIAFAAFAVGVTRRGSAGLTVNHKLLLVASMWLSIVLSVVMAGSLAIQRSDDGAAIGPVWPVVLVGFLIATAVGALAWFFLPQGSRAANAAAAAPLPIAAGERVYWSRRVGLGAMGTGIVIGAVVLALAAAVVTALFAPTALGFAVAALVFVALVGATTTRWKVSASASGLVVRGVLGWPRMTVAAADIRSVGVATVDPLGEFGGWGFRWGAPDRSGLIMQAGEAIEVTRSNGKRFVVTVDDARTGAAVLAAYIGQHV